MPTLKFNKKELISLVGKKIDDKDLIKIIHSLKPNVENISEDEVEIEMTSDRIDYFCIEGLARAIRSYIGINNPKLRISKPKLDIIKEDVPVRPYIGCAVIRNLRMTEDLIRSLMNTQEVIHETYGRKRKKVAIGLHDLDKIKGEIKYIGVKREEKFVPLGENTEMSLLEVLAKTEKGRKYGEIIYNANKWPVFCDELGIFSFPPILNSERTKITSNTRNIFIDVTGIDKTAVSKVLNLFSMIFIERGAEVEAVKIKGNHIEITPDFTEKAFEISLEKVEKILGIRLKEDEIVRLLEKMDYDAKISKGKIIAIVKPYRFDIISDYDIIEDIAISYGYENFEPSLPNVFTIGEIHPIERISNKVREVLVGFGFQEIVRPILTNPHLQFEKMNIPREETIRIVNPVSELYTELRKWLLPSLMDFLSKNTKEDYPQRIFELGDVVIKDNKSETKSRNIRKVCGVIAENKSLYSEVKAIVIAISKILGKDISFEETNHPTFIHGRVAKIIENGKEIGIFGEINPIVLENFKIYMPVAAFEMSLE